MRPTFVCPECNHEHDDPAEAAYVLAVTCDACAVVAILERRAPEARPPHATIRTAA